MRQPFNADTRAQEREETPTTIGGKDFFPVRLSNTTMKTVRSLARKSAPAAKALEAAEQQLNALQMKLASAQGEQPPNPDTIAALQTEISAAEDVVADREDEQQDASSVALFEQLHHLLVDGEKAHPDAEYIAQHLDTRDAGPLMTWLMTDGDEGNSSTSTTPESPPPTATGT